MLAAYFTFSKVWRSAPSIFRLQAGLFQTFDEQVWLLASVWLLNNLASDPCRCQAQAVDTFPNLVIVLDHCVANRSQVAVAATGTLRVHGTAVVYFLIDRSLAG